MDKTIKHLVNEYFECNECAKKDLCIYGSGNAHPMDCNSCPARPFAIGIHALANHLMTKMSLDEAMATIVDISKSDKY